MWLLKKFLGWLSSAEAASPLAIPEKAQDPIAPKPQSTLPDEINGLSYAELAPQIMARLMIDFPIDDEGAAAIVGNLGHESNGFHSLQEISPVVKGSRGGYGWAQWTGPRRVAYETYCRRNQLNPTSNKANYAWLFTELTNGEKRAIAAVKAAKGLESKVIAFERAFLRAGIKHYPSRVAWAQRALKSFQA